MLSTMAYNQDNYAYFMEGKNYNLLVDAGNFEEISTYLENHHKKPDYILLTHHHHDHIEGALKLKEKYKALIIASRLMDIDYADIHEEQSLQLGLSFLSTPGHTADSGLWLYNDEQNVPIAAFCGDVLFSCGCGRQFQGIGENLYKAMEAIAQLDGRYRLCCGHEYTQSNIDFCRQIFPHDEALHHYAFEVQTRLMENQPTLPILLSKEKTVNPFLRFHEKELQAAIATDNAMDFLIKLRQMRNDF